MCQYISCDPRYANDINIVYSSTVQKMLTYMNTFMNTTLNAKYSDFKTQLTSPTSLYNIDLLFYCARIINDFLNSIYQTYVNCYKSYTDDLITSKTLFVSLSLSVTGIGLLLLLIHFRMIYVNQHYLKDIVAIVKTDSFITEEVNLGEENQKA